MFLRYEISGGGQEEDDCGGEEQDERVDDAVGGGAVAEVVRAHAGLDGEARHLLRDALVQFGAALVRHGCKARGTECCSIFMGVNSIQLADFGPTHKLCDTTPSTKFNL